MDILGFFLLVAILLVIPIITLVALIRSRRIEERVRQLHRNLAPLKDLQERLSRLEHEVRALRESTKPTPAPAEEKPAPAPAPIRLPAVPPGMQRKAEPAPSQPRRLVILPAPDTDEPPPAPGATPATAPAEPPSAPPPPPPKPPRQRPRFDWEGLVGVKLFSWVAAVALLFAAVFFLRYSIDRGWLLPQVRLGIGIVVGIGLLVLCEIKAARRYPTTANAMDASAVAILFATFFAAHALWHLISPAVAFLLLALVTATAVLLSVRRDSLFIALLGLVGGFATPALLSSGENRPIPLFGYLLLLNAGLAWIALRKGWPLLTTLSLVLTTLYQWGWVSKFLTSGQLPLAAGIFLIFPILTFASLALRRGAEEPRGWISLYGQTANLGAFLPLLFAVYLACVPGYGTHHATLFGFLFLVATGLAVIAALRGPEMLHLIGGLSTIVVFATWLKLSYNGEGWPAVLAYTGLFVLLYLAAPVVAARFGRGFAAEGRNGVLAAPLLLFTFPILLLLEPRCAAPGLLFGILFVLLAAISAHALFAQNGMPYVLAAGFALVAEAVWSTKYLTPERLLPALAIYGVFSLVFISVPLAARRWNRRLPPEQAGGGLILCSLGLLFFLAAGPEAHLSLWGIALLLLLLNGALLLQGSASRAPLIAVLGLILSWIILATLWAGTPVFEILVPALLVVAGFSLVSLAGSIWLVRECAQERNTDLLNHSMFLGLAGHMFLLVVASQESLAVPPWPLLGILLVLDLAIGAAALYTRRHELHLAALASSAVILLVWVVVARVAPWPSVSILSGGALAAFSLLWTRLAARAGIQSGGFAAGSALTIVLAQVIAVVASVQPGSLGIGFLVATQVVLLAAMLALAWIRNCHGLAVIAVLPAALAVSVWQTRNPENWQGQLLFATAAYLIFLCYPLLLGRRAGAAIAPYQAAVLASACFFLQARHSLVLAGYGGIVGALPLTQSALMALLLTTLLRIEPAGARRLGRLALVAGASLAFLTVAIPLQLEREWITLGWALEGMALAWLYGKIPHRGLSYAATDLLAAAFARLALNPFIFTYQPRGNLRIWNWYLYTYLISAATMFVAGWLMSKTRDDLIHGLRASRILPAGGTILLFLLLNIEIADFFSTGPAIAFNFAADLAQDLTYTLGWALFGVGMLAAGIALRSQAARIAAIALLGVTVLKCFVHDLARLGGLYRVSSFVGLAVCLALVALALQKFVLSAREKAR